MYQPNPPNARPAQISTTNDDRTAFEAIQRRAALYDVRVQGPTIIFRAGLAWLASLEDDALVAILESFSEKLTPAMIQERFALWCSQVNNHVCRDEVALQYAWGAHSFFDDRTPLTQRQNVDVGNFRHQTRFVHLSATQDGRIVIFGFESNLKPFAPGEPFPHATQLFPGGLTALLSMNDDGADLAARAIVAWLMGKDDEIDAVRVDVRRHIAQPLAPITSNSRRTNLRELGYAREKLYLATLGLTSGMGDIHERLESAMIGLSVLSNPNLNLPNRIRDAFDDLWHNLTWRDAEEPGEGTIHVTIRHLSAEEAAQFAERVFELYFAALGITPFGRPREDGAA